MPGQKLNGQLSSYARDGSFLVIGRNLGDRVLPARVARSSAARVGPWPVAGALLAWLSDPRRSRKGEPGKADGFRFLAPIPVAVAPGKSRIAKGVGVGPLARDLRPKQTRAITLDW